MARKVERRDRDVVVESVVTREKYRVAEKPSGLRDHSKVTYH